MALRLTSPSDEVRKAAVDAISATARRGDADAIAACAVKLEHSKWGPRRAGAAALQYVVAECDIRTAAAIAAVIDHEDEALWAKHKSATMEWVAQRCDSTEDGGASGARILHWHRTYNPR